ncbi:MAG TPA: CBS domain-containing protein [Thermoanaerobaculia bacterium]|nr:CBS domain-containing protein [Thermoanaerobaculia bacterium]
MRIQDVMSKRVVSIAPKATISDARETLRTVEIDHLVVVSGKQIVGVIAGKDLARAGDEQPVENAMTRDVVTIEPEATLRHAAGVMRGRAIGCLPVVDDERLVGIVTTSDLLTALAKGDTHTSPPSERVTLRKRGPRKRAATI